MTANDILISFVQFEHDGRLRATGAFRLPDWPLRMTTDPSMAVESARSSLVSRGGHYPVMVTTSAMGPDAAPTTEINDHFRRIADLAPEAVRASLLQTRELARRVHRPGLPKPGGQFCARVGCQRAATFDRPLCYAHWKGWDGYELAECERCHWLLSPEVGEAFHWSIAEDLDVGFHCDPCLAEVLGEDGWPFANRLNREQLGEVPTPIARAPLARVLRYVYILKMDDGDMYVGQTPNLVVRMREHRDNLVQSTKHRSPRLVYFETHEGVKDLVSDREDKLTLMNLDPLGRRRLREMIENFQAPLRLVDLNT